MVFISSMEVALRSSALILSSISLAFCSEIGVISDAFITPFLHRFTGSLAKGFLEAFLPGPTIARAGAGPGPPLVITAGAGSGPPPSFHSTKCKRRSFCARR